jgi:hypothetical protein
LNEGLVAAISAMVEEPKDNSEDEEKTKLRSNLLAMLMKILKIRMNCHLI